MKNNEFLNLNKHKQNTSESNDINMEDSSVKKEDINIEVLRQELSGPYKQAHIYTLKQVHVNNINIYGNQGNELFNQEPKSVGDKICEFFKNLFCCGCGCVKTRD